jgi:hypothetical protein
MYKYSGAAWRLRPLKAADCSPCLTIFRACLNLMAGHYPSCGVGRRLLEAVQPAAKKPLSLDVRTEDTGAASDSRARQVRLVSA